MVEARSASGARPNVVSVGLSTCALAVVVALGFCYQLVALGQLWIATYHPLPWHDEWDTLSFLMAMERAPLDVRQYFVPHNEHRLFVPRLVFALDFWLFRGLHLFTFACSGMFVLATVALYWRQLRDAGLRGAPFAVLAAATACTLVNGWQMSNFLWAFQVQWLATHFFMVAALTFVAQAAGTRADPHGRAGFRWLLIGLACGVASNFCTASGVFAWPSILVTALLIRRRLPKHAIGLLVATAVVAVGAYFNGLQLSGTGSSSLAIALQKPLSVLWFFLAYLGNPLTSFGMAAAFSGGGMYLLASAWIAVRVTRLGMHVPPGAELVSIGVLVFVLLTAAATSVGRLQLGIEGATESRLASASGLGWAALAVIAGLNALGRGVLWPARDKSSLSRASFLRLAGVAVAALMIGVGGYVRPPYDYLPLTRLKADALTALVAGVDDEAAFKVVGYANLDAKRRSEVTAFLERTKRSIRAEPVFSLAGRSAEKNFSGFRRDCTGTVDKVDVVNVSPQTAKGFRAMGWSWDRIRRRAGDFLVFVNESGTIIGYGQRAIERPDVLAGERSVTESRSGWIGHGRADGTSFVAYLYSPSDNTLCLASGVTPIPRQAD